MRPLPISPETAQRLAKELNVPLEHLMHMPQYILMQKLAELAKQKTDDTVKNPAPEPGHSDSE